jgi:hypothetical protein
MSRVPGRLSTSIAAVLAVVGLSCPQSGLQPDTPATPSEVESTAAVQEPSATDDVAPLFEAPLSAEEVAPVQEPEVAEPSPTDLRAAADVEAQQDVAEPPEEAAEDDPNEEVDEPIAEPAPREEVFELVALRKETWVFAEPRWNAPKLGYLRSGTTIRRDERAAGFKHCKGGWYRVEPKGYVCIGKSATLETHHAMAEAAGRAPDRAKGLPYPYVMADFPPPPRYVRLPTESEQAEVEPDLTKHRQRKKDLSAFEPILEAVPGSLLYQRSLPSPYAKPRAEDTLHTGRPVPRTGWGLLHVFSWTDRLFGVTTDLDLIPLDRTKPVATSTMVGTHLVEDQGLPLAFVHAHGARLYRIDLETRVVQDVGDVRFREGFSLTGRRARVGEHVYLETREGTFLREGPRMVIIPAMKEVPSWATPGRKWIDVSILRQTLVAYEGTRPVFATMVSTGSDGLGDPKETRSTVLGAFLIHTKHVTTTMSSDEEGDVYDLQDVPYVQYFHEGYALHGAYWHDGFGTPRSHGCINLSPYDAAWLFGWTDPEVPKGWHAKLQLRGGTLVYTHP